MKVIHPVHPVDFKTYSTSTVRERFLLEDLKVEDQINLAYTHYDRLIVGLASPVKETTLQLSNYSNLRSDYFLERREMGIINVGGEGEIVADGKTYSLGKLDCLYLGKGTKEVKFTSLNGEKPLFYILSAPAHANFPSTLMKKEDAEGGDMGSAETANKRTIYRYIHKNGIQSCQLVMGLTVLHTGSVWNTMPAHVHDRRSEIYFYFDVPEDQRVFHYMGEPDETRHILIANHQVVLSPSWSIHSGSGTSNYSFIWGMAGENLEYSDMDPVPVQDIR